ncbi:MAG: hypothetical protein AAF547_08715 [Actinomycetota bacterium]
MSAITYPAGTSQGRHPKARSTAAARRRMAAWRPVRRDERQSIERSGSPSEVALRSIIGIPVMHR